MGSISGTLTRRDALRLAGSGSAALVAALTGLPKGHGALDLQDAVAADAASPATAQAVTGSFQSRALRSRLHFVAHLPSGYSSSSSRYPVIYFLHGLPATPTSYLHLGWVAQALAQTSREAILVMPQGTRVVDGDSEYHDWGPSNDWETALAQELPAWIDATYRTVASRRGRAIVGYSAGGYGASIIGLRHPQTFAAVQSWSGYFHPTDPTGRTTVSVGSAAEDADASVESLVPTLAKQFERYPTAFAFYVGAADPLFVRANSSLQQSLTAARVTHLFRLYPGGHTTALWQKHAPGWLALAVDSLAGASAL